MAGIQHNKLLEFIIIFIPHVSGYSAGTPAREIVAINNIQKPKACLSHCFVSGTFDV